MPEQIQGLIENLKGFGVRRLALMGGIAALVMAVIGVASVYLNRPAYETLYIGLDRADVNQIGLVLGDAGIVRHRGKIESTINNARRATDLAGEFGSLSAYFWRYEPAASARPKRFTWDVLGKLSSTRESIALSKDLKQRGWTFVGPTTVYAFMQAMGLVNDHLHGCAFRKC